MNKGSLLGGEKVLGELTVWRHRERERVVGGLEGDEVGGAG